MNKSKKKIKKVDIKQEESEPIPDKKKIKKVVAEVDEIAKTFEDEEVDPLSETESEESDEIDVYDEETDPFGDKWEK